MDAALAGKSWEELEAMHADLERAERRTLSGSEVGNPAKCEEVGGHIEAPALEDAQRSSFDAEGRYIATDEDIPF